MMQLSLHQIPKSFNTNQEVTIMATNISRTTILRRQEVEKITGMATSTLYLKIKNGHFPKPIKLGERSVGWLENEIDEWINKRIEQRDREAI